MRRTGVIDRRVLITTEIRKGVVLADRYRVRGRLGVGGMATVFLAEDCVLGRDVAIKRLHSTGSDADERRFRREARIGASLMHPNLVTVFDTLDVPEGLLIVMEHVRGEPLSAWIEGGALDPSSVIEILRPVASALDFAHTHGVVHRDVKPANILIGSAGNVKLVDLGTATAEHLTRITAERELVGTLSYIAPERLAAESMGEPAADIYSVAVVAFEAMAGCTPHRAKTPAELLTQASEGRPRLLEKWPEAPPRVAAVLAQGMDPDPGMRQSSAGALVRDLEAACAASAAREQPEMAEPAEAIPWTPQHLAPKGRSRRARWVAPAALLACAGAVVGLWLALNGGGSGGGSPTGHPGGAARHAAHAAPAKSASSGGGSSSGAVANGSGGGGSVTSAAAVPAAGGGSPAEGA
jgi:serine/threonine protein kinase